jgi:hypothetical protein
MEKMLAIWMESVISMSENVMVIEKDNWMGLRSNKYWWEMVLASPMVSVLETVQRKGAMKTE